MTSEEELQKKRTPDELAIYIDSIFDFIRSDKDAREIARMKKDVFKVLIEEIYPFSIYCKLKYVGKNILCRPVIGSQGFDGTIESNTGELIEIVEITWPIDGQKEHFKLKQLNERGYTDVEIWDYNDSSKIMDFIDRIIKKAYDKSLKNYKTEKGSALVFVLDIEPYFDVERLEHKEKIEFLKTKLKEIKFNVKEQYILLLPIQELIEIKNS
jgi:hypothetical protein